MRCNSQENAVFIAIHPTSYRSGGFLAHGVLNDFLIIKRVGLFLKSTRFLFGTFCFVLVSDLLPVTHLIALFQKNI